MVSNPPIGNTITFLFSYSLLGIGSGKRVPHLRRLKDSEEVTFIHSLSSLKPEMFVEKENKKEKTGSFLRIFRF
ncbi:hypothetical protein AKJ39_00505 [candidate division MSBL1 archaeon SCGC-AAA259J03]|uniref:Uncharacterized protein n=1 Tax=candidate division MSBL1 archaeon SCGC-AAA259J03 TaxID=1698269 RepID=A0A656YXL9_9EURY|nr:hypothetical protein AKJ39_00505 [candidate division MSBL1 archaeon SCGC-AAA259J03]